MVTAKKTSTTAAEVAPKAKAPAKKVAVVKAPVPVPAAPPKAVAKKTPAKKAAAAKAGAVSAAAQSAVPAEQRHHYIEVAAFYVAQRRGFAPGNPTDDWAMAEVEVDQLILSGHFSK